MAKQASFHCAAMAKGATVKPFTKRCSNAVAHNGEVCGFHAQALQRDPAWPLFAENHRSKLLAALGAGAPAAHGQDAAQTPASDKTPDDKKQPAKEDAIGEFLKKTAFPAIIATIVGAMALAIEQIYLAAFDIDLGVIGSQTDNASLLLRNSGYVLAAVAAAVITAVVFVLTLFLVGYAAPYSKLPAGIGVEAGRATGSVLWSVWRTMYAFENIIRAKLAALKPGSFLSRIKQLPPLARLDAEESKRISLETRKRISGRIESSTKKYMEFLSNCVALLFKGNDGRNWQRTSLAMALAGSALAVGLTFSRARDLQACAEKWTAETAGREFCASYWPDFLVRRPQIVMLVFKPEAKSLQNINLSDSACQSVNNRPPCFIARNGVSGPLLHVGNYGSHGFFRIPGPGGRTLTIPLADISFMSQGEISAPQSKAERQAGWTASFTWIVNALSVTPGGSQKLVIIERERSGLTDAIKGLSGSVDEVRKSISGQIAPQAARPLQRSGRLQRGLRYAALAQGSVTDANPPAAEPGDQPDPVQSKSVIAALDAIAGKMDNSNTAMGLVAAALGNPLEKVMAPDANLAARLGEINTTLKGLRPVITVNPPQVLVTAIPAKVHVLNFVQPAPVTIPPPNPLAVEFTDGAIDKLLAAAEKFKPVFKIDGTAADAALPSQWTGVPPRINALCDANWNTQILGEPFGFPKLAASLPRGKLAAKLQLVLDALKERALAESAAPDQLPGWAILVEGSADSLGSPMANLAIAESRAAFVQSALEDAIAADSGLRAVFKPGHANWEAVSYGIGEQFGYDSAQGDGDDASPRVVRIRLCRKAKPDGNGEPNDGNEPMASAQ